MATVIRAQKATLPSIKALWIKLNLTALLQQWWLNHRTRDQLAHLPDFMLKDVGISRSDAEQESQKPFWVN